MNITVFESVTTESALIELEAEGKKYDGLYVDMDKAPERKYVKDKAAFIAGLLKKLDRTRIDAAKDYKVEVEKQAQEIKSRLQDANSNFQLLIDGYNIERKKILDEEKAREQAILDAAQKELDHEMALLINKTYEFDRAERTRIAIAQQEQVEAQALKKAVDRLAALSEAKKQDDINAQITRLENKKHCAEINRTALGDFILFCDFTEEQARAAVKAIAKNQISNTVINY